MTLALHKVEPDSIGSGEDGFRFWPVILTYPADWRELVRGLPDARGA